MPKNLFQEIIFGAIMVIVMVYAMVCYNIALETGGLTNEAFVAAFSEMWEAAVALVLELVLVGPIAKKLTFRVLDPAKNAPILITLMLSAITVAFMCPLMSMVATLAIKQPSAENFFATWLQTVACNFPMALCWQLFYAGPLVRLIFRAIFVYPGRHKEKKLAAAAAESAAAGSEQAHDNT